jgi:hypothetical protein
MVDRPGQGKDDSAWGGLSQAALGNCRRSAAHSLNPGRRPRRQSWIEELANDGEACRHLRSNLGAARPARFSFASTGVSGTPSASSRMVSSGAKRVCLFGPLELDRLPQRVAIAGALHAVGAIRSGMGLAARASRGGEDHPWDRMFGEAHPLDCVEGQPRSK